METKTPEEEVDQAHLTDLVRKALGKPGLQVTEWHAKALHGGVQWDSCIYRFKGQARDVMDDLPWSLVLKVARPSEKAGNLGGIWYWKREALGYQTGLLHHLPGGNVTAPACYSVEARPDGSLWLWLEEIKDDVPCPWSLEQYALVARQLGQFNGAYLTGKACPAEEWIPRNWLRLYVENAAPAIAFMHAHPDNPVVQRMFPGVTLAQVFAIWDEHDRILQVLERLPQVFCHQDAFRRNLFVRRGKTVAIDWGYMGYAPLGTELVALVAASLGFWEIPADQVRELDRMCFEGYVQGLREAGWTGDPKLARIGYVVGLMLRYPIGGQVGEGLPKMLDQAERTKVAQSFENKTAEDIERLDPATMAYYEHILPESLRMLGFPLMLRTAGRMAWHFLRLNAMKKKSR